MRTLLVLAIVSLAALAPTAAARRYDLDILLHDNPLHIAPENITANVGDSFTLTVQNSGQTQHDLLVCLEAPKVSPTCSHEAARTKLIPAGGHETITVAFNAPGKFEYYCTVPQHKQAGQRGTITVQGEAAPTPHKSPGPEISLVVLALAAIPLILRRR